MQRLMPEIYTTNLKKNPDKPIAEVYCKSKAMPGTLEKAFLYIESKFGKSLAKWRKRALKDTQIMFAPIANKQLGKISFRDIDSILSKTNQSVSSRTTSLSRLVGLLRIVIDKQIPGPANPTARAVDPIIPTIENGEIKIKHQLLSNDEALALINNSRGRNPLFRMNLLAQLRAALDANQSYAFTPLNLHENPVERKKGVANLKNAIHKTITENKLPMGCHYIESRNLFIIIKKENTNESIKK